MNILSFDTSTKAASIAILSDDILLGEIVINDKRTHSQKLMPIMESLFALANITVEDIDILAVCVGPGSFTGLRIAMATVKAFAHVRNIPIVAVNSLETLARGISHSSKVIVPILDAQRDQVYSAKYKTENNELKIIDDISVISIDDLIQEIKEKNEDVLMVGEAVYKYSEKLKKNGIEFCEDDANIARASKVAYAALKKYSENQDIKSCYDILPMYIRKSQAEEQYEEKQRKMREGR